MHIKVGIPLSTGSSAIFLAVISASVSFCYRPTAATITSQESHIEPQFFVSKGLDQDGSLVANYRRGLDYAIRYFGNYGPYKIYLLGPGNEQDIRAIFRQRAESRVVLQSSESREEQIESFLNRPNTIREIEDVLAGNAMGGLTWSGPENRIYEDVTTNATSRAQDPIENTWGALHEYHHVFQVAHSDSYKDRSSDHNFNSWMLEGMATYSSALFMERLGLADFEAYMLALRKNGANIGRPGINEFLSEATDITLDNETYWDEGPSAQVYYMMGAWAAAYLIHGLKVTEEIVLKKWYQDLPKYGKAEAFERNMNITLREFYDRFDGFIKKPDEVVMETLRSRTKSDRRQELQNKSQQ